jgi:small ligand-binding sensory domain FIST
MRFKSVISTEAETSAAIGEVSQKLAGMKPDLAIVFASHHHGPDFDELSTAIAEQVDARNMIGCTAEGVIGPDREVEQAPALAVWTAKMPGVSILPFVLDQSDVTEFETPADWQEHLGADPESNPAFIMLPDPFSIDVEHCLAAMDLTYPEAKIVGGMASGASQPGQNSLFLNGQALRQGMVGVSLAGPVEIHTIVSQGCRPIGEAFVITKAERNVIHELRGRPALDVLKEVFNAAEPADQALMQKGIHVGSVVDERLPSFGRGDFLIRNVTDVINDSALVVNSLVRLGNTIQFHVRDSNTADDDMKKLLAGKMTQLGAAPTGGLLFSCNGRGRRLFGKPDHDIAIVNELAAGCQVAGFFAAGEIGPIGNRSFIHGFTSSLILFQDARS